PTPPSCLLSLHDALPIFLAASAKAHPGSDVLLYALANAQDRAGMKQKALSTMRKVLALQPAHSGALNYIGYTLVEQGLLLHAGADRKSRRLNSSHRTSSY